MAGWNRPYKVPDSMRGQALLIPRVHLFELEDQAWFPAIVRDLATDYLRFMQDRLALHRPLVPLLAEALRRSGAGRVVDLCAGRRPGRPRRAPDHLRFLVSSSLFLGVT